VTTVRWFVVAFLVLVVARLVVLGIIVLVNVLSKPG
jgi:hypothetical protein